MVGSLRPGAGIDEARVQLRDLAKRAGLAYPATNRDAGFSARPASEVAHQGMGVGIYLMAMVGLVLVDLLRQCCQSPVSADGAEAAGNSDAPGFGERDRGGWWANF